MLVELAHLRVDGGRVEVGPGERVERRHDAHVGRGAHVPAPELVGQRSDEVGADVAGAGDVRHEERQLRGFGPVGHEADLRIAEYERGHRPVRGGGGCGDHGRPHVGPDGPQQPADGGADDRAERHLLRTQTEGAAHGPGNCADRGRRRRSAPAGQRAERGGERRAHEDPVRQRGDLVGLLAAPGHRLGGGHQDGARERPRHPPAGGAARAQAEPRQPAHQRGRRQPRGVGSTGVGHGRSRCLRCVRT